MIEWRPTVFDLQTLKDRWSGFSGGAMVLSISRSPRGYAPTLFDGSGTCEWFDTPEEAQNKGVVLFTEWLGGANLAPIPDSCGKCGGVITPLMVCSRCYIDNL